MDINNNNEMQNDSNESGQLGFEHDFQQAYRNDTHHYRGPFLGYGFIGPFATGLLGGLAVNALFGGYNGYGYGGYPYYGGYVYPSPYYYGGYGYPYWRYS